MKSLVTLKIKANFSLPAEWRVILLMKHVWPFFLTASTLVCIVFNIGHPNFFPLVMFRTLRK